MEVIIYYIDTIMVYIQLQLKVKPSYPPHIVIAPYITPLLSPCVQCARGEWASVLRPSASSEGRKLLDVRLV